MGSAAIYWQANRGMKDRRYILLLIVLVLVVALVTITISLPQTVERLHFVTLVCLVFSASDYFQSG